MPAETIAIKIPDLGDTADVEVVEVLVAVGDVVEAEQGLITLESDKASMEVPSPQAGTIREIKVSEGDSAAEGDLVAVLEIGDQAATNESAAQATDDGSANAEASSGDASETDTSDGDEISDEADTDAEKAPADETQRAASHSDDDEQAAQASSEIQQSDSEGFDAEGADLQCDVVVLGAGPGGYSAAFRAADLGLDVILVEKYPILGGVCLNVGCIPSKALLHVAKLLEEARGAHEHGISFGEPTIDLDRLRAWKDEVIARLTGGLSQMSRQRQVRVVTATGTLAGPHRLRAETDEGSQTIAFRHAILAAGSRPVTLPGFPEDERLMDSTGALELRDIPERLLVIGGGIIGLEMATVYHALGSRVWVVELLPQLMTGADKDLVRPLQKRLEKSYEAIWTGTRVARMEAEDDGLRAYFEVPDGGPDGVPESMVFDRVLLSVGRVPNGHLIGAPAAGLVVDERGYLSVDRQQRTSVPHILAIGDLVGQPMLAHKAVHEGHVAAEVAAGEKSYFDARVIPSVAYTDPEVAWVGLTETEAKASGIKVEKSIFPWSASGRSLAQGRDEGKTKLLVDPTTQKIVGAGIVGPHAGDLIAEIALAIEMGCEVEDVALTIHPHPTLSESVGLAAEAYLGTITDLYVPKKRRK